MYECGTSDLPDEYCLEYRPYSRRFRQPLQTHHGLWTVREGVVLRLEDKGKVGFGEIAPLSWFGSECLEQAIAFCSHLSGEVTAETVFSIPSRLPACQFGFESAWESLTLPKPEQSPSLPSSLLLPTGAAALNFWQSLQDQAGQTFKWKIGVAPLREELKLFEQLVQSLPPDAKLRLDANGGLSWDEACRWLETCDRLSLGNPDQSFCQIEFLEQPLPPDQIDAMLTLSQCYSTPIALDESVATLAELEACYERGWRGIFVVKAAIAGSPQRLREFCQKRRVDVVWSSAFETAIAQQFIQTRLIPAVSPSTRAIGFGVNHWFSDQLDQPDFERLWQSL